MFRAATERAAREHEARVQAAWVTASLMMTAFHSPRQFPDWDKVRPRRREVPKAQSAEEIKIMARAWTVVMGGTIRNR